MAIMDLTAGRQINCDQKFCLLRARSSELAGWFAFFLLFPFIGSTQVAAQPAPAPTATDRVSESGTETFFGIKLVKGYSDNVQRDVESLERSANYTAAGAVIDLRRTGPRLDASVLTDLERRAFSSSVIEDETFGSFDASLQFDLVPDTVMWIVEENYGQGRTDAFDLNSPDNREQIHLFSTGPRFAIPIGDRTLIEASSIVASQEYKASTGLDNDTNTHEFGLNRALSSTATFGVFFSRRDIEYDLAGLDNTIENSYLTYEKELSTGAARLSAGVSDLTSSTAQNSTPFVELFWSRDLGVRSRLSVSFGNSFIDANEAFRTSTPDSLTLERLSDVLLSADVYEQSSIGVAYAIEGERTDFQLGFSVLRDDYEIDSNFDNKQDRVDLQLRRRIRQQIEAGLSMFFSDRDFQQVSQIDRDRGIGIWLRKSIGTRTSLDFSIDRYQREITQTQDVAENSARIIFQVEIGPGA
jgi:hypothetical protein